MLFFASNTVLAYSGSECEVNDCSQPSKAQSNTNRGQAKTKSEAGPATKGKPTTVKEQAMGHAKDKVTEKVPSQLQGLIDFLKWRGPLTVANIKLAIRQQ